MNNKSHRQARKSTRTSISAYDRMDLGDFLSPEAGMPEETGRGLFDVPDDPDNFLDDADSLTEEDEEEDD